MATLPDMYKGEGMIRTYDLLSHLITDVEHSFEYLDKDSSSQYLRRNVIRCTFSFIEAIIQIIKFEINADYRLERTNVTLSKRDKEILHEIREVDGKKIPWNIPLDENLKKTFAMAVKAWELKRNHLNCASKDYKLFRMGKFTRNKLTHPRTFYDVQISDEEIGIIAKNFQWIRDSFINLLNEKIETILSTLPSEFVHRYRAQTLKHYYNSFQNR